MMIEFDVGVYNSEREVENCPIHFIKTQTPITHDALNWVRNTLKGRYSLIFSEDETTNFIFTQKLNIYFEDPSEATVYELRWSGSTNKLI